MESSGRAHSVPRPAFGGAMLTLLRVRRAARLRRRPELDGASRPLRRAGSWQPSFFVVSQAGYAERIRSFVAGKWGRTAVAIRMPKGLQTFDQIDGVWVTER
jgi:hypothetical protein